jgi:hypothetical protein
VREAAEPARPAWLEIKSTRTARDLLWKYSGPHQRFDFRSSVMKKIALVVALPFVFWLGCPWQSDARQGTQLAKLMMAKLDNSKKLLEGIALADFNRISTSAEELLQLSRKAEWFVFKTPKFELFTNEFQRAAENVITKAKAKNIDGATLAYFELTMSCVRCHQYVREVRDARLAPAVGDVNRLAFHEGNKP